MNLALVSDNSTNQGKEAIRYLISEVDRKGRELSVAYFASQPDPDKIFFEDIRQFYESLAVKTVHYIELEDNYDEAYVKKCLSSSLIHLSGGDTFRFLFWLKKRGMDVVLKRYAREGKPFVGISAGAIIMTPNIDSAALCGDINTIALMDTSSLDLVPFLLAPHAEKNHKEVVNAISFKASSNIKIALCSDSDALVVKKSKIIEFGNPLWI
ncbi:Type 1 glutamine amidotransferase-like domain-containing protein [Vibrio nigripulchritudo]|uniref:Type 1 glutamine amidotransferase-like domain-containing protein n=1 Tax=Vibrio nigripulchritudo TaxID=28173 RepID=UPI0003B18D9D|nr:Type 1 glutamine amidotransferase-like domain-containing protein [Vibrio nigripulchritudo]CCN70092.1 putative Peptidase S51, dipeptidase E [Vibrio nigripulchritudo SFn118]